MLKGAGWGRKLPYIKNKLISAFTQLFFFQIVNPSDHEFRIQPFEDESVF